MPAEVFLIIKNPAAAGFFVLHTLYGFDTQGIQTQLQGLRRQLRQLQAAVADRFIFRRQNRAVLVEAGEQTRQIVQVSAHNVRRTVTGDNRQRLLKLQ